MKKGAKHADQARAPRRRLSKDTRYGTTRQSTCIIWLALTPAPKKRSNIFGTSWKQTRQRKWPTSALVCNKSMPCSAASYITTNDLFNYSTIHDQDKSKP